MYQKTLKKTINFSGTGLHSGKKTHISLKPAPINTGIIFILNGNKIPLHIKNINNTTRSIAIGKTPNLIMTVEHLIAALYISEITNLFIEMNNNEVPAMDGSALPFLKMAAKSGIMAQKEPLKPIELSKPEKLFQDEKFIIALPSDKLKITYAINFDHPQLKGRSIHFSEISLKIFKKKIAPARTFGFEHEIKSLYDRGLALGGNLKNAVVCSETGYLNKKLRFQDECIRHKVLDFIGALAFLNRPVKGHFIIYRSGHKFDLEFIKILTEKNTKE